tara:strand:+ start:6236 stop:6382 length:147 start_codon:yes stop_codon:yes gene_type:complete
MKLIATFLIILIIVNFIKNLFQTRIKKESEVSKESNKDIIDIDYEEIE